MAEKEIIKDELRERILDLVSFNVPQALIAETLGISKSSVHRAAAAIELIKNADWDKLYATPYNYTRRDIEFYSKHLGVEIPATPPKIERAAEPEEIIAPDNTAVAVAQIMRNLEAMAQAVERLNGKHANLQNALAEQFKHLEDIISVNTDIISEAQRKSLDALNGIKMNTRKRGE